jgi:hypothetical protein
MTLNDQMKKKADQKNKYKQDGDEMFKLSFDLVLILANCLDGSTAQPKFTIPITGASQSNFVQLILTLIIMNWATTGAPEASPNQHRIIS